MALRKWHNMWDVWGGLAWGSLLLTELLHITKIMDLGLSEPLWVGIKGAQLSFFVLFFYRHNWESLLSQRSHEQHPGFLINPLGSRTVILFSSAIVPLLFHLLAPQFLLESSMKMVRSISETVLLVFLVYWLTDSYATAKTLVLFGQSEKSRKQFRWFELALFCSLILLLFEQDLVWISYLNVVLTILFGAASIVLSLRLKWVAELDFLEKLRESRGIWITFASALIAIFIFSKTVQIPSMGIAQLGGSVFFNIMLFFISFYFLISGIVILSNIPTTELIKKRLKEAESFKTLGNKIRETKNTSDLITLLHESIHENMEINAMWIETKDGELKLADGIEHREMEEIKLLYDINLHDNSEVKMLNLGPVLALKKNQNAKTVLAVPLQSWDQQLGMMYLIKNGSNSFNLSNITLAGAFSRQISAAIHNLDLVDNALSSERLEREMIIAKEIQQSVLPTSFDTGGEFEITAIANAASAMGGDYYDFYRMSEHRFLVVIADVSGKGIPAAFHMAQFKGIFQTLASQGLMPDEFLDKANEAVSKCIPKGKFITVSIFMIDSAEHKVYHARGGHCPALLVKDDTGQVSLLENKGLGLGILRNSKFLQHIELDEFTYQQGDLIVLYTDGITEAANEETGEQYQTKRLQKYVAAHHEEQIQDIADGILSDVKAFSKDNLDADDHSLVIIRF